MLLLDVHILQWCVLEFALYCKIDITIYTATPPYPMSLCIGNSVSSCLLLIPGQPMQPRTLMHAYMHVMSSCDLYQTFGK